MTSLLVAPLPGDMISYTEYNTDVTISATTEATANTAVTAPALIANGLDSYWIEYYGGIQAGGSAGAECRVCLFDNGNPISAGASMIANVTNTSAVLIFATFPCRRLLTPSAGSHTYSIRAYRTVVNGLLRGNAGAQGEPGWIKITRAT